MVYIITQISKIILIAFLGLYTIEAYSSMTIKDPEALTRNHIRQRVFMYLLHFTGFAIVFLVEREIKFLLFYGLQVLVFSIFMNLYDLFYDKASTLIVNNMILFMMISMIILSRLNIDHAIRQFVFASGGMVICTLVPLIIHKLRFLDRLTYIYLAIGLVSLAVVLIYAKTTYGAKLSIPLGPVSIQPSEFVKITFVFYLACMLFNNTEFKNIIITTIFSAIHVLLLVFSKDLGAALIFFVVYMIMVFVATKDLRYLLIIMAGGIVASVVAYKLFSHVQVRVTAFIDPFSVIDDAGYQVAQSLFAIGSGGFLGLGLYQGMPKTIPVVEEDFIFSAISEEFGLIFAILLILLFLATFIMFLNIALQIKKQFYKLVALGLSVVYAFQVFLTLGGVTKFIPSTGVTLPLISYGGSSLVSTILIFSIIQGLYILREDQGKEPISYEKGKQK